MRTPNCGNGITTFLTSDLQTDGQTVEGSRATKRSRSLLYNWILFTLLRDSRRKCVFTRNSQDDTRDRCLLVAGKGKWPARKVAFPLPLYLEYGSQHTQKKKPKTVVSPINCRLTFLMQLPETALLIRFYTQAFIVVKVFSAVYPTFTWCAAVKTGK